MLAAGIFVGRPYVVASSITYLFVYCEWFSLVPNAYWAAFTAAILTSDSEGALWQVRLAHTLTERITCKTTSVNGYSQLLLLITLPSDLLGV